MKGFVLMDIGCISSFEPSELITIKPTVEEAMRMCPEASWTTQNLESEEYWFGTPGVLAVFNLETYDLAALGHVLI